MRTIIAAAAVLALGGCSDGWDDDRVSRADSWAIAAATPVGPPVDCIAQADVRGHAVRDDRTIDFSLEDGSLLRNRLPFACPGLTRAARIAYRTALPRLCSTATITLVRANGDAAGNCGLGAFQPIAVPPQ